MLSNEHEAKVAEVGQDELRKVVGGEDWSVLPFPPKFPPPDPIHYPRPIPPRPDA